MEYSRFRPLLACPECRGSLEDGPERLSCARCNATYPIRGGVPILLARDSAAVGKAGDAFFHRDDSREVRARGNPLWRITNLPDPAVRSKRPVKTRQVFEREVMAGNGLILNLGSGVHKQYTNPNILNLDIARHENVDVVGDGLRLPLAGGEFDGAVLDAVLEHVPDPFRVVAEVHRVLRPGGFVLAHAPFLYPYHGAPHDYFRYTDEGLRRVFAEFEEVECDTDHLPTRALLEILRVYAGIFADGRKRSFALRFLTAWGTLPLKFWDRYLQRKEKSHLVVAGFSYLGRKR